MILHTGGNGHGSIGSTSLCCILFPVVCLTYYKFCGVCGGILLTQRIHYNPSQLYLTSGPQNSPKSTRNLLVVILGVPDIVSMEGRG